MQTWRFKSALLNLIIAAVLGGVLRLAHVVEIPGLNYKYLLHAHSHVAMLGWLYLALFHAIIEAFLPADKARSPFYDWVFWLSQGTVLGMLLSFPFQGYGPVSIAFSMAQLLLSYAFVLRLWGDLPAGRGRSSFFLLRAALLIQALSTLGIWAMGPIMGMGLRNGSLYFLSVQFFLHFQFFGWFMLALLALFFRHWENSGAVLLEKQLRRFSALFLPAIFLSFGLVVNWVTGIKWMLAVNGLGIVLQAAALFILARAIRPVHGQLRVQFHPAGRLLVGVAIAAFALRILIQLSGVLPVMATIGTVVRNYAIGFLHLQLLGVASCFLLGYALGRPGYLQVGKFTTIGVGFFLAGFLGSEFLLFFQGTALWAGVGFLPAYHELLLGISLLLPLGLLVVFLSSLHQELVGAEQQDYPPVSKKKHQGLSFPVLATSVKASR